MSVRFGLSKAIILAGGKGSRMLPWTSAVSKTMLPIIDKPVLHYVVEEILNAGIKDIMIVVGYKKDQIIEYFKQNRLSNINFVVQKEQLGTGDALKCARDWINKDNVLVAVGDELYDGTNCNHKKIIPLLLDCYKHHNNTVIGCKMLSKKDATRFGVIQYKEYGKSKLLTNIIEKPKEEDIITPLVNVGRYVLKNEVLKYLDTTLLNSNNELALTDVIVEYSKNHNVICCEYKGPQYDVGSKSGYVSTFIQYAKL